MPELIWNGKYNDNGQIVAPPRVALPFQTVETVNQSAQERQMANSGIVIINAAYNNSHGESVSRPGPRFTAGDNLFNCSERCSPLVVSTA